LYRILSYFSYSIFNILFFSYISVFIYQTYCLSYDNNILVPSNDYFFTQSYIFYFLHLLNIYISSADLFDSFFFFYYYVPEITHFTCWDLIFDFSLFSYYNVFELYIFTKTSYSYDINSYLINFFCLHNSVWIIPNETVLLFFRLHNNSDLVLDCMSIYVLYPLEYTYFFVKLQCFCFSSLRIYSNELLELPIVFYFDVNDIDIIARYIYIFYILLYY
jgi:cytochrome c oxidase assembly protein Cox11